MVSPYGFGADMKAGPLVFSTGIVPVATLAILGANFGSEAFLALVGLVSYGSYVVSSLCGGSQPPIGAPSAS
jgi:hypothetical protein